LVKSAYCGVWAVGIPGDERKTDMVGKKSSRETAGRTGGRTLGKGNGELHLGQRPTKLVQKVGMTGALEAHRESEKAGKGTQSEVLK